MCFSREITDVVIMVTKLTKLVNTHAQGFMSTMAAFNLKEIQSDLSIKIIMA